MWFFNLPLTIYHPHTSVIWFLLRVCQMTKDYAEDYLRMHPRSKKTSIYLRCPTSGNTDRGVTLDTFLEQDRLNSIPKPVNRLIIHDSGYSFEHPLISGFLERYGNGIRHVQISRMTFAHVLLGIQFLEKLPKLKSLKVSSVTSAAGYPGKSKYIEGGSWFLFDSFNI